MKKEEINMTQKINFLINSILFSLLFPNSCTNNTETKSKQSNTKTRKTIIVQPMGNFDLKLAKHTMKELQKIYPYFVLKPSCDLPKYAFYKVKNRYRADSILNRLRYQYGGDTVVIAVLNPDISVTKGKIADWGVMGLGHRPGNTCVVSTYRLEKKNLAEQFFKVCIHELGHTQGLPHCPDKTCYMRDAKGGNPLEEEVHFCEKCKKNLEGKGWKLKP
jgi:archaemetzincin